MKGRYVYSSQFTFRRYLLTKKLQQFRMIILSIIFRCSAVLVCYVGISAVGEEEPDDLQPVLTGRKREVQRCHSLRLLDIGIGAVLYKELDEPDIVS